MVEPRQAELLYMVPFSRSLTLLTERQGSGTMLCWVIDVRPSVGPRPVDPANPVFVAIQPTLVPSLLQPGGKAHTYAYRSGG